MTVTTETTVNVFGQPSTTTTAPILAGQSLNDVFTYHPPKPSQAEVYDRIREAAKAFALLLVNNCPASADLTLAIRGVETAVFHANASVARNPNKYP
jgi:hypothetical protein